MAHLTEEDRNRLERYLGKGLSFRTMAESLGKNSSMISRKIRNHRISSRKTTEPCVTKWYYMAGVAQKRYLRKLKESREGVNKTEDELHDVRFSCFFLEVLPGMTLYGLHYVVY